MELKRIDNSNVWKIVNLTVSDNQAEFVATNSESLIEAYLCLANNGHVFPFGIYENDIPIGFVMIGYDVDDDYSNAPKIAFGNYNIWRFMIDKNYQNKGYGRKALELALDYIKTFPCGKAEYCYLSYEPNNVVAKKLYAEFGFEENGEMDDDELIAVLKLQQENYDD